MRSSLGNGTWSTATVAYDGKMSLNQSALVTGLTAATNYGFSVVPLNYRSLCFYGDWEGEGEVLNITTHSAAVPSQPKNVRGTVVTGGSITVAWDLPKSTGGQLIIGYTVFISKLADEVTEFEPMFVSASPAVLFGLDASTEYQFTVCAVNSIGPGANSTQLSISTLEPTLPGPVKNLKQVPSISGGVIILSWDSPDDTGGVAVQYYTIIRNGTWVENVASTGTRTYYTDSANISANQVYLYNVAAATSADSGKQLADIFAWSGIATVPSTPFVAIGDVRGGSVVVMWTPSADTGGLPLRYFSVHLLRNGVLFSSYTGLELSQQLYGLYADTDYDVAVFASNDVGSSDWAYAHFLTASAEPPGNLPAPSVVSIFGGRVQLKLTAPANFGGSRVLSYIVYVNGTRAVVVNQSELVYDVVGLVASTAYSFSATAVNLIGEGEAGDSVTIFTGPVSQPGVVDSLTLEFRSPTSIRVRWESPVDSGGDSTPLTYSIQMSSSNKTISAGSNVISPYSFDALIPSTAYTICVQAANSFGSGNWSDNLSVTTDAMSPGVIEFSTVSLNVSEADSFAKLPLSRSNGSAPTVCTYYTIDGTAKRNIHYVDANDTLLFGSGIVEKNISIGIINNNVTDDPDKYFFVVIQQSSNQTATIGTRSIVNVTIVDDGDAGVFQFTQSKYSVLESAGSVTITVDRAGGASGNVTIAVTGFDIPDRDCVQNVDYQLPSTPLKFSDQETRASIDISITNDSIFQPHKQFGILLAVVSGRATVGDLRTAIVDILDDGDVSSPSVPTAITAKALSGGSVNISWLAPNNSGAANASITSYNINVVSSKSGSAQNLTSLTTAIIVADLYAFTEYQFFVLARTTQRVGNYSSPVVVTMGFPTPPSAPRNVEITARSGGSTTIGWTRPVDAGGADVLQYSVALRNGSDGSIIASQSTVGTQAMFYGLLALTKYTVEVAAVNSASLIGLWSDPVLFSTRTATAPGKPLGISILTATGGSLQLKMNPPLDAGGLSSLTYRLFLASPQSPNMFSEIYTGDNCQYVINGLTYSTTYNLKYLVVNDAVRAALSLQRLGVVDCHATDWCWISVCITNRV